MKSDYPPVQIQRRFFDINEPDYLTFLNRMVERKRLSKEKEALYEEYAKWKENVMCNFFRHTGASRYPEFKDWIPAYAGMT